MLRTIALAVVAVVASHATAADVMTGEQIYKKQCVSCHGASGEGAKAYPQPLAGDKSTMQLAKLIAKTMPDDDPGTLSSEEADKVATYVFDTFYSKAARLRNKPRVELSRLTVGQYRNAVADLIGSFRGPSGKWDDKRGLRGEYFNSRDFRNNKRIIDRIDPEVNFDFGVAGPDPDKFEANQFCIRWEGSVLAPETGEYEFIVNTDHATQLWVNDNKTALIDAWVKSGNDTQFRGSLFLLGGRAYPLRLEFAKAKQGVDDKKKSEKQVKASIALLWKQPKRPPEEIPARYLSPKGVPETFVASTSFPPDDRSLGWERGTSISKAWDQASTDAALEAADYVVARLNELAGIKDGAADRDVKAREFCKKLAERAFRRPLTDEQKKLFIDRQFEAAKETDAAVKRVVLLILKSPRFLYREVGGESNSYDTASRLAFALWDAPPDAELAKAAAEGKLATREQVAKQAERMMTDLRARAKLREFLHKWLKVDQVPDIAKDPKRYASFDAAVASDLRTSLDLFLDDVIGSPSGDFRQLLLADDLYLNGRLAEFYEADFPDDDEAGFQKVKLDAKQRAGVLTHPYLMSAFAYTGSTSPIHRGVFIGRGILGVTMRPPPEAFTPLEEKMHPELTTRERVALQTKPAACISCHSVINPLGFTLEHFDAVGRYREKDNDKPVDATGSYQTRAGKTVTFKGIRDLAKFLAASEDVHAAFTEQLFHHLIKQPVQAYGPKTLTNLRESFAKNGFNIRKLAEEIAITAALPPKRPEN